MVKSLFFVLSTVYRVNNINKINHESIMNTLKTYIIKTETLEKSLLLVILT